MKDVFEKYLLLLRQDRGEKTELSDRGALETLLKAAAEHAGPGIRVIHEAKKVRGKGGPDFKVMKAAMILGYVEDKTIGENLDQVLKSDQIARYKQLSNNILLTDYLQFIWIKDGKVNGRELIALADDLEGRPKKPREDRVNAVSTLLHRFFSTAPEGIAESEKLALELAKRSRFLRDHLDEELRRQEKERMEGRLYGLFQVFRNQVFHELTLADFADAFAQMLAYGLFLAKLNSDSQTITLHNARQYVPGSFRLIRELVDFLSELEKDEYSDVRWVVGEILSIVNGLKLDEIQEDLSFKHRKAISRKVRAKDEEEHRLFERDPFIYFYEDFLAKYDAKMKKSRGVYYTPPPIVNFIVRAIDDSLKGTFGIKDGLADNRRVTVLDFACGTGTFLLEVFERVFDNIGGPDAGRAGPIVREHLLKNIFGFEYLIAPYTIAHLKLSQYLADKEHALADGERLPVLLTNTLEPIEPQKHLLLPAVTAEVEAAQKVKETPILVITGNPPYSGHSKNKGPWITTAIDEYKFTREKTADGLEEKKPLGERNPKWLQDDYVKFLRFAQMKMDGFTFKTKAPGGKLIVHSIPGVENGVVGVITNHSWLDNPTFRGMRQSLMRSFNQIYVLDLHGNAKKKERAPDGSDDQNVFDIEQGVAISLFVKGRGLERSVWRGDLWGKRLAKYQFAAGQTMETVDWQKLDPRAPDFLMFPQDHEKKQRYDSGWKVTDIFPVNSVGVVTARDHLSIHFDKTALMKTVRDFAAIDTEAAREKYSLGGDVRDWRVAWAQADLHESGLRDKLATEILYRPFDRRWTYYTGKSRGFLCYPRGEVMRHMLHDNLGLITSRLTKGEVFKHAQVQDRMIEVICMSPNTSNNGFLFPLYLYSETDGRSENLSPKFRAFVDSRYEHHYTPEDILGYIYAVLHAPMYRTRYAEFLRIDFPRIPFPESGDDFEALAGLGWALVQTHLLRELPRCGLAAYHGKGDHTVEAVRYSPQEQAISINKAQFFKPVPQNVWEFHIGGYQVLDKYLKSRKGRKLTLDEINHVSAIADSLAFTIEQMAKIDEAYRAAFPDRG
jgi:predicted helicase